MVGFAFLESPPGIFTCPLMWACWCHMATCLALREGPYVGLEASGQFCLTRHFLEILGSVQAVAICARGRHAWPFPLKHMVLFQTGFKPLVTAARACVLVRRYVPSIQSCCWQIMLDARRFYFAPPLECRHVREHQLEFLDSSFCQAQLSTGFLTTLCSSGLPGLISPAFGYAAAYFLAAMVACLDFLSFGQGRDEKRIASYGIIMMIGD